MERRFPCPVPSYPAAASSVGASGQVAVQVIIDENGRVISAVPVSGHSLLKASAAEAAKRSTFSATKMSGQPVKVSGIITYNFQSAQNSQASVGQLSVAETPETPENTAEKAPEPPTSEMVTEAARIEREAKLRADRLRKSFTSGYSPPSNGCRRG